jgi:cell division protein FtsI (penicillin-binding protein 3)
VADTPRIAGIPRRQRAHLEERRAPPSRFHWLLALFAVAVLILVGRALYLHVMHREFLQQQGDARLLRVVPIAAHRGRLLDRNGEALAVSTPVDSLWIKPADFIQARARWPELHLLGLTPAAIDKLLRGRMGREFVYLQRHVKPHLAAQIMALQLPGLFAQREYRRYYPNGEITAHALGFTNIDDIGQEGLELAFNDALQGIPGSKRVIQNRHGHIIADVENIQMPRPGKDVRLSIDRRISYLAYRELNEAVTRHRAKAGSLVVLAPDTGEILALVNQPGYNPNNRRELHGSRYRNRAVTDVFEPGSTMKSFSIAAGLDSGKYLPATVVDTSPGTLRVRGYTVRDPRNYGRMSVTEVLKKSSNVGTSKIALALEPQQFWHILNKAGFGVPGGSGFPGEASGMLPFYRDWRPSSQASMSFGYGLNTTLLQLAHAYTIFANDGELRPLRFVATSAEETPLPGVPVISAATARAMRTMLEAAVIDGTGKLAQVPRYRIAGKTGTAHKAIKGGYAKDSYTALFIGMAPAARPRLLVAVFLDEPRVGGHYGGEVAAPVFATVMGGALRLLNIAP